MQRVAREKLSPSAFAVLGLLGRAPAAGYELGTVALRSIAHFWPLTRTHIYTELARLESLGFAVASKVAQDDRPDKRVYTLTAAGEKVLEEWLNDPEVPPERNRIPVLLKLFFGQRIRPDRLAAIIETYRERAQADRDAYAAIVDDLGERHPDEVYSRITALYGLRQVDAMLSWLSEVESLVGTGTGRATRGRELTGTTPKRRSGPAGRA